jgi:hypothetical protein
MEARLACFGQALMENRAGPIVNAGLIVKLPDAGRRPCQAHRRVGDDRANHQPPTEITLGTDKGFHRRVRRAGMVANSPGSSGRIVIDGVCASACTMKLGGRNACAEPDGTLLFHQASYNSLRSELATRVMLYSYPSRIRQWVLRTDALNSSALTELWAVMPSPWAFAHVDRRLDPISGGCAP